MKVFWLNLAFLFVAQLVLAQGPYAPAPGNENSDAIHVDSSAFIHWADYCIVNRGWLNIADTSLGLASAGSEEFCNGPAGESGIVSLGDGGEAILSFDGVIFDAPGPDFAIFENSFSDFYLELAHVEVSSDGVNYLRFPSVSLTQTDTQVGPFGLLDPTYIYNLAGKYRALYGTPFDLAELEGSDNLDINAITHVKIIDVVGSINEELASSDSEGYIINDPYPTEFESSGFDLDALGIINWSLEMGVNEGDLSSKNIYPNPFNERITMELSSGDKAIIYDSAGRTILEFNSDNDAQTIVNTSTWKEGFYIIKINQTQYYQIIKAL